MKFFSKKKGDDISRNDFKIAGFYLESCMRFLTGKKREIENQQIKDQS